MKNQDLQVMVDLETMSTQPNAAICSIGACKFTLNPATITSTFYTTIDAKDCKRLGLHFCPDTIRWWSRQLPEVLEMLRKETKPLKDAITEFALWYGSVPMPIWANGANFDPIVIRQSYKAVDLVPRWTYREERCYRTIAALFPDIKEPERSGSYHNALDDAIHQTKHLQQILGS